MIKRLLFIFILGLCATARAQAELTIQITQGVQGALPIAIVPFGWKGTTPPPQDLAAIVSADLARSGRFAPVPRKNLVAQPHDAAAVNFKDWRTLGADNLVVGKLSLQADGRYQVQFQLLDVLGAKQLTGYSIVSQGSDLRQTAHQISDIIYQTLTGQRGAFDTHIAYVTVSTDKAGKRTYRLAVADADGHDEQTIFTSSQPILSPSWAPDGQRLAYVSFAGGRPGIYIQNVLTQKVERIAHFPGLNSAPAWSPDGTRMAMTLSRGGNPDIYIMNLKTRALTRITHSYAIDTEAAWMPDGKSLVFTSDRGGSPQLYQIPVAGAGAPQGATGPAQRLTFDGSYNARASISPDGQHIAMVHGVGGAFHIAVLDMSSGDLQVLTNTPLDESPSFAPNGSMIIYATEENNRGVLEVVSVDGKVHQRLSLQGGSVREPAWSPFKH